MTFNERITAAWPEKEILKYPPPMGTPIRSVVVDATSIALPTDRNARIIVPGGTLMRRTADNKRVVPFDGTGKIEGVLKAPVELLSNTTVGRRMIGHHFGIVAGQASAGDARALRDALSDWWV